MKVSSYISQNLKSIPAGSVFTYMRFLREKSEKEAAIKALNRKVQAGELAKLSKGRYYKPEKTVFGTLSPSQEEVVKDLLWKGSERVGYLTGLSVYNKLGLTTQVGNTIQIGKNDIRPAFNRGKYKIAFVKQKNPITKTNIPFLQVLDAIRLIKKIPDTSIQDACKRLLSILSQMNVGEVRKMIALAKKYPPSTRALLGALLETVEVSNTRLKPLRDSLNPITSYKLEGVAEAFPAFSNWNIK